MSTENPKKYVDRLKIRGYPIITRGTLDNVFVIYCILLNFTIYFTVICHNLLNIHELILQLMYFTLFYKTKIHLENF
jgi:hypothetical protein